MKFSPSWSRSAASSCASLYASQSSMPALQGAGATAHDDLLNRARAWADAPCSPSERRDEAVRTLKRWIDERDAARPLQFHDLGLSSLPPLPDDLRKLYVSGQRLQTMPTLPFGLTTCRFHRAGITSALQLPAQLEELCVIDESLEELPPLPASLVRLKAHDNPRLVSIGTGDLPELCYLDLCRNRIGAIVNVMPGLKTARLSHNEIVDISGLKSARHLVQLRLDHNRLRRLDEAFFALPEQARIDVRHNHLSIPVAIELTERVQAPDYAGPHVRASIQRWTKDCDERGLQALVNEWTVSNATALHGWDAFDGEPHANDFARFLQKLGLTVNTFEPAFRGQVHAWLSELQARPRLRALVFALAHEASGDCEDRVTLTYNQMHVARMSADAQDGLYDDRLREFIELARGMFRLDALERIAHEHAARMTGDVDQIEVMLGYQTRLRDALDLPLQAKDMAFFEHWSQLDQADLDAAKRTVRRRENAKFERYFAQWPPWHDVLERIRPGLLAAVREELVERVCSEAFDRCVDELLGAQGLAGDAHARVRIGAQVNRQFGEDAHRTMTHGVLDALGLAADLAPRWPEPSAEQRLQQSARVSL